MRIFFSHLLLIFYIHVHVQKLTEREGCGARGGGGVAGKQCSRVLLWILWTNLFLTKWLLNDCDHFWSWRQGYLKKESTYWIISFTRKLRKDYQIKIIDRAYRLITVQSQTGRNLQFLLLLILSKIILLPPNVKMRKKKKKELYNFR